MLRFSLTTILLTGLSLASFSQTGPLRLWGVVSSDDSPGNEHPGNGFVYSVKSDGSDFAIVKSFLPNPDGGVPRGKLLQRANGEFFGTTYVGGTNDWGAVYKLSSDGSVYSKLFDFSKATGGLPIGSLVESGSGKLFGLTQQGSTSNHGGIFSILPDGSNFQKHYEFSTSEAPYAPLLRASDGNFYGTLVRGPNQGILYKLNETTLAFTDVYSFNFWNFNGPLIEGQDGKIYGAGNLQNGTLVIFRINKDGSTYEVVHTYGGYGDVSLLQLPSGKLVGATSFGGQSNSGQLFSMDPDGSNYTELFDFSGVATFPGALILGSNGKLYGMGGDNGYGMVYEINTDGTNFTVVSSGGFSHGTPTRFNGIIESTDGSLYVTASTGGASLLGTIGKLTKAGVFTKLKEFVQEGSDPDGGLTLGSNGKLYGSTSSGGPDGWGTLFSIDKNGTGFTTLFNFDGINGRTPVGRLVEMPDGFLYGLTRNGGNQLSGNLFKIDLAGNNFSTVKDFEFFQGNPTGSLIKGQDGYLYGVTGSNNSNIKGILYKVQTNGSGFSVVVDFAAHESLVGTQSVGITQLSSGDIIGVTSFGGANFAGTVFKVATDGGNLLKLKDLAGGVFVAGSKNVPIEASNGKLYGTSFFDRAIYSFGVDGGGTSTFTSAQYFQSFGKLVELDNSLYAATAGQLIRFNLMNNAFTHFNWGLNGYDNMVLLPKGGLTVVDDRQSQTITFDPLPSKSFGSGQIQLVSTTTSGLNVQFSSSNTSVATLEGNKLTMVGVGQTILTATQPGDQAYKPAQSKTQTLTVTKGNQVIRLFPDGDSPRNTGEEPFDPHSWASSGLPVSYTSSNPSVAKVTNGKVEPIAAGDVTITVSQNGNDLFLPAANVTFDVSVRVDNAPFEILREFGDVPGRSQFFFPRGIEVDNDGNIYVACSQENRVKKISPAGNLLFSIGGRGASSGSMYSPYDVDLYNHELFVLERLNGRIQVFSESGDFVRHFGSPGSGPGQLASPSSLAISSNGTVFISDSGNNRIVAFDVAGRFLFSFGSFGAGNGQFKVPSGISLDAVGNVYVADGNNHRVQVFNSEGVFLRSIGSFGTGNGQFVTARFVDVHPNGDLYVLDGYHGVQVFDNSGTYTRSFEMPSVDGNPANVYFLAVTNTQVIASDFLAGRILRFDLTGNQIGALGEIEDPQLKEIVGVAMDQQNRIYVTGNGNVKVFDVKGNLLRKFGSRGTGNGQFAEIGKPAIAANGEVIVPDTNGRIQIFDSNGVFLRAFGTMGSGNGQFSNPACVAVDKNGRIYVADAGMNARIQVFENNGDFVSSFGSVGSGDGQFNGLNSVFVDSDLKIYATDNFKTQIFDSNGNHLKTISGGVLQVVVDPSSNILTADVDNHRIAVHNSLGELISTIGSYGSGTSSQGSHFYLPMAIALNPSGSLLAVADVGNRSVKLFGTPKMEVVVDATINSGSIIDFGDVQIQGTTEKTLTIKNTGDVPLKQRGSSLVVSGPSANDFSITQTNTFPIEPGGEKTVKVAFTPSVAGMRDAEFSISTNDGKAGTFLVKLHGNSLKKAQSITFSAVGDRKYGDSPFSLDGTSSSGLTVSFVSSDDKIVSISGTTVTILEPGDVMITARQEGDAVFAAATDVQQKLHVTKASQTISFSALDDTVLGAAPFSLTASTTANLPVQFSADDKVSLVGSVATILKAGRTAIKANQPGDKNYEPAMEVAQAFCINPPRPTITTTDVVLSSSGDSGNMWYLNGQPIEDANQKQLTAKVDGTYTVRVQVDDCVSQSSDPVVLVITGDLENSKAVELNFYPNPVDDTVVFGITGEEEVPITYSILDLVGRTIAGGKAITNKEVSLSLGELQAGAYLLKAQTTNRVYSKQFIKR